MAEYRPSSVETMTSRHVGFGEFRLDPDTGELWRNDKEIRLPPRAAALLSALAERSMQVVTKQELIDRVWHGKAVGDDALTSCVRELRRALGDDSRRPRLLETRHRRGYRLLLPATPAATKGLATERLAPLSPADKPSLAVLPFDNLSPDLDQDYFADGVVEDMTTALTRIGAFFVIARNSSFAFKGRKVPVQEVGRQLGVRYIVEGSIRRAGPKLRLTAQLIEAESGHHLWAEHYDGEMADVFDLQNHVVSSIVGAINPTVRAAEIMRARLKRPENLQAYDYVLRAQPGFQSLLDPGHAEALALFHKALELEPSYALAMALAAWAHAQRFNRYMQGDPAEHRRQAFELANAALDLAPNDPGVLVPACQALLVAGSDETERCFFLFGKALGLDPNSALAWRLLGQSHVARSEPALARRAFEHAMRLSPLDPLTAWGWAGIADVEMMEGRLDEALRLYRQCLAEKPRESLFRRRVCALLALTGEREQARRLAREIKADAPQVGLDHLSARSPLLPTSLLERILHGLRLAGFE
jgi:TolB-like protein/Flp pilus assembly protein TadD